MNYFDDKKNRDCFSSILDSWKGTPFLLCKAIKGRGVDCSQLLGRSFEEAKIFTCVENPRHPMDWFVHTRENQLLFNLVKKHYDQYLAKGISYSLHSYQEGFELVYGDVLFFTMQSKSPIKNHIGIYVGEEKIIQSVQNQAVHEKILTKHFYDNLTDIFRLEKEA